MTMDRSSYYFSIRKTPDPVSGLYQKDKYLYIIFINQLAPYHDARKTGVSVLYIYQKTGVNVSRLCQIDSCPYMMTSVSQISLYYLYIWNGETTV